MKPIELFNKLENTGNYFSYFKKGKKYVYFKTGGYSENEELIAELKKTNCYNILIESWKRGGHYKFNIPPKKLLNYDYD